MPEKLAEAWQIVQRDFPEALWETIYVTILSTLFAIIIGLPLGISFYMFQSMGYTVDVYRETAKAERNPLKLALFVSSKLSALEQVTGTQTCFVLKRYKEDVKEVGTNFECGISLTSQDDIKVGDIIETFVEVEVKQKL